MKMPDWKAIDLQKKPNQRERIIFALALLIFFGAFVKSCWIPSRRAISNVKNQLHLMVIPSARGKEISLPAEGQAFFGGSIKEMEAALGQLSNPQVLKGVRLLKSHFSEEERQGSWVRRRVEFELSGSFPAVGRYLNTLESWPAPLWIELFSMKTSGGRLTASVTGSFYGKE